MDNMAYLQQIAGVDNSVNQKKKNDNPLAKLFNVWTFLILGILAVLVVIVMVIVSALNKVDIKDQELMQRSYWMAHNLVDTTFGEYNEHIKNSDIRNMSASFRGVLNEIILNEKNQLSSEFQFEIDDVDEETDAILKEEKEKIEKLNETLYEAKINGILDRVYLREMTMQIAYLRAHQSEIVARTKNSTVSDFSQRMVDNLDNLYEQFHNFKNLAM